VLMKVGNDHNGGTMANLSGPAEITTKIVILVGSRGTRK